MHCSRVVGVSYKIGEARAGLYIDCRGRAAVVAMAPEDLQPNKKLTSSWHSGDCIEMCLVACHLHVIISYLISVNSSTASTGSFPALSCMQSTASYWATTRLTSGPPKCSLWYGCNRVIASMSALFT